MSVWHLGNYDICLSWYGSGAAVDGEDASEEDFSQGLYSFLRRVDHCRQCRQQHTQPLTDNNVHIENRLVAATTFEKSYV